MKNEVADTVSAIVEISGESIRFRERTCSLLKLPKEIQNAIRERTTRNRTVAHTLPETPVYDSFSCASMNISIGAPSSKESFLDIFKLMDLRPCSILDIYGVWNFFIISSSNVTSSVSYSLAVCITSASMPRTPF